MDTRYLEYILTLAETGNITRAAKKLYISQPTLSQFLTKQEQELGTPLFQRTEGIYTLTPVGTLYAQYAEKVLELTRQLEQDIHRVSNITQIRIGTSAARARQILSSVLADFRAQCPKAELSFSDDNLRAISQSLAQGQLDMAFVTAHSLDGFRGHSVELQKEEVVFAVPSTHPCSLKLLSGPQCHMADHALDARELLAHFGTSPFILQHEGSCIRYLVDSFFENQEFHPAIACSTNHVQIICDMISNGVGVGFIPISYADTVPNITCFSLSPRLHRIHAILYRKDLVLGPPHKYLMELAQNYVAEHWNT